MKLDIRGEDSGNYFVILCEKCNEEVLSEYLGFDPGVPHFRWTCRKCNASGERKLSVHSWRGLPTSRHSGKGT